MTFMVLMDSNGLIFVNYGHIQNKIISGFSFSAFKNTYKHIFDYCLLMIGNFRWHGSLYRERSSLLSKSAALQTSASCYHVPVTYFEFWTCP
jgi:hypothetical protein